MIKLKTVIEDTDSRAGRTFDLCIQALIVFSLITFSIETLPNLGTATRYWLRVCEVVTVSIFTIEYALRILVADNRLKFIFSFYGLVDFLAIVPFYTRLALDLRAVRIFRMFRLFRVFKMLRYSKAIDRLWKAFVSIKEELVLYMIATAFITFVASVGMYYFEGPSQPEAFGSVFHCLWWSVVTLTTVGYGDVYPITLGGRIFTTIILLLGLGVVAVPTGLLASALTKTNKSD